MVELQARCYRFSWEIGAENQLGIFDMSTGETAEAASKVPIGASIWQAYSGVVGRPRAFAKIALLPSLLIAAIIAAHFLIPWPHHPSHSLSFLLLLFPLSHIGFAWLRFSLNSEKAGVIPNGPWVGAYARLLCLTVLCLVWIFGVPSAIVVGGGKLLLILAEEFREYHRYFADGTLPTALWIGLAAISVFLLGRASLAAAAIALRPPASLRTVWRWSRGQDLRLGSGLVLLTLSLLVVQAVCFFAVALTYVISHDVLGIDRNPDIDDHAPLVTAVTIFVAGAIAGSALFAEFVAIAFKHLTGCSVWREELLERFE